MKKTKESSAPHGRTQERIYGLLASDESLRGFVKDLLRQYLDSAAGFSVQKMKAQRADVEAATQAYKARRKNPAHSDGSRVPDDSKLPDGRSDWIWAPFYEFKGPFAADGVRNVESKTIRGAWVKQRPDEPPEFGLSLMMAGAIVAAWYDSRGDTGTTLTSGGRATIPFPHLFDHSLLPKMQRDADGGSNRRTLAEGFWHRLTHDLPRAGPHTSLLSQWLCQSPSLLKAATDTVLNAWATSSPGGLQEAGQPDVYLPLRDFPVDLRERIRKANGPNRRRCAVRRKKVAGEWRYAASDAIQHWKSEFSREWLREHELIDDVESTGVTRKVR